MNDFRINSSDTYGIYDFRINSSDTCGIYDFRINAGNTTYNPLINYDWSTTTASGLRYLKDVGSTPTYNASMYFGRGAYLNGVDQTITVPINTTIQTALKRVNGVVTINETSQTLTNYVISGLGVHKDYYLFTRLLTTAEKDSYTNTPELFYAMAQADSTCVLNMPMCETDGYVRNMKSYIEGNELANSLIPHGNNILVNNMDGTYTLTVVDTATGMAQNINPVTTPLLIKYTIISSTATSGTLYSWFGSTVTNPIKTISYVIPLIRSSGDVRFDSLNIGAEITFSLSIKKVTGIYPITNYTTSVRDNAKNLQYGLQTCKFVRDSSGVIQSASDYLECNGIGYAIIPSHADTVNIKMTVNPTSLSGNLLSGGVTKTLTGLTLNVDNNVVISNVAPTGTITLASGFSGTIKTYTEELV